MSWLLRENYHLFVDLNQYAGHVPVLDQVMIFCANDLIFLIDVSGQWLWSKG